MYVVSTVAASLYHEVGASARRTPGKRDNDMTRAGERRQNAVTMLAGASIAWVIFSVTLCVLYVSGWIGSRQQRKSITSSR